MKEVSIKQSEEPESIRAENCPLERVGILENETSEGSQFFRETEAGENRLLERGENILDRGTETPGKESRPLQEPKEKETKTQREQGLERADMFKQTMPCTRTG
jgi:hypothetical protein